MAALSTAAFQFQRTRNTVHALRVIRSSATPTALFAALDAFVEMPGRQP
jgi:hypothetical protein